MTLPPELWVAIFRLLETQDTPFASRQLFHVALVSSFFHALALPILYSHLRLLTYAPSVSHPRSHFFHNHYAPTLVLPAVTAIATLSSQPVLQTAIKSIYLIGQLDTVMLSRRTSTRTSEITTANGVRDLLVSILPTLSSLRSILFNAVALTPGLCTALFHLPQLSQLILKDCRAPAPACSIFRERPNDIRLTAVEVTFSSWTDTPAETALISSFVHGPHLASLTTDQPGVLTSLLTPSRQVSPMLHKLELYNFGQEDVPLIVEFLTKGCITLRVLTLQNCDFSTWSSELDSVFPILSELQTYTGPRMLARRLIAAGANLDHVKLTSLDLPEDTADLSDLRILAHSSRPLWSLDLRLGHESLLDEETWAALGDLFPMLRALRIEHGLPMEVFQTHILSRCLTTLPSLERLETFTFAVSADKPDSSWQSKTVREMENARSTLREVSFDIEHVWLRLARGEWKEFKIDKL